MSTADIERFVEDLKHNADLLAEVKGQASGLASVVEVARSHGYNITLAEAQAYIQEARTKTELSDDELDEVAGGKVGLVVATNVGEMAETVTSVAEAVETVSTVAQDAEAATTVVAVAEIVAVAT